MCWGTTTKLLATSSRVVTALAPSQIPAKEAGVLCRRGDPWKGIDTRTGYFCRDQALLQGLGTFPPPLVSLNSSCNARWDESNCSF